MKYIFLGLNHETEICYYIAVLFQIYQDSGHISLLLWVYSLGFISNYGALMLGIALVLIY